MKISNITNIKYPISNVILILIILLGFFLRVVNIFNVPPGLTPDEASLGYNSYSLLKTGRDEFGKLFPLYLKSFGENKSAIYSYLDTPFVELLGLNEMAVRLPSIIFGLALIVLVYLVTGELFGKKILSICCAFLTAISPLAIIFSRGAWESNLAFVLNVMAVFLFIKAWQKQVWFIYSGILFGLSVLLYQPFIIFVLFYLFGLVLIYRKQIKYQRNIFIGLAILFILCLIVFANIFWSGFNSQIPSTEQAFLYIRDLTAKYVNYFSPKTLFIGGELDHRQSVPDLGILNYFEVFLLPGGLFFLWKNLKQSKIILYWLLVAPIPAVLSGDFINLERGLNLVFPWIIISGAGLYCLLNYCSKLPNLVKPVMFLIISGVIFVNLGIWLDRYFIHLPFEYSEDFGLANKQLWGFLNSRDLSKYKSIMISDSYDQPYIYYLFYNKYSPQEFQKQAISGQLAIDGGTIRRIDNIEFKHIFWPGERSRENGLFVGPADELPDVDIADTDKFTTLKEINFLDGKNAYRIVETR